MGVGGWFGERFVVGGSWFAGFCCFGWCCVVVLET